MGGARLLVGTRIALWLGVQLLQTGLLVLAGQAATGSQALNDAAIIGQHGHCRNPARTPTP